MATVSKTKGIYQFRFFVLKISSMIWIRIHDFRGSTISDRHYAFLITMGHPDSSPRFVMVSKNGIGELGTTFAASGMFAS